MRFGLPTFVGVMVIQVYLRLSANCMMDPFVIIETLYTGMLAFCVCIGMELFRVKVDQNFVEGSWSIKVLIFPLGTGVFVIGYYATQGMKFLC